jgi:cytosine/adenosine deaminase-related metal-dependent hydrolase/ubiquinone/menaquinone biosynthesis C-methylase UbiE
MSTPLETPRLSTTDGYRLWARSYDDELNPMLSLERRFLEPLLPAVAGLDVVDLGCGTGRWLELLKSAKPRSLLGVDCSPEMLDVAESKLGAAARLMKSNVGEMPLSPGSADLVLCNFVLSYLEDASFLLHAASRILREGGSLFVSDLHPETARVLNWRRGVRLQDGFHEIHTKTRPLAEVKALCESANLNCRLCIEPRFGKPERHICESAGKRESFDLAANYPAIYILQLCHTPPLRGRAVRSDVSGTSATIQGARVSLGAQSSIDARLEIVDSRIRCLRSAGSNEFPGANGAPKIDLSGFLLLPGLVNAHDHLEFALFPRLGTGKYKNFLEWAEDIHKPTRSPIREHRKVPRDVRLWWGGIRNLLCGVTTVCHHNPYEPVVFANDFVVHVLPDYTWAHSLSLDAEAAAKKRNAPKGQPFLIHLAEGLDEGSSQEIFDLDRAGALDEDTVIIHGLALRRKGRELLRSTGAGLVWCPSSNVFLFGKTFSSTQIRSFPRVALGSDSPLTSQGDLLDELRFAREVSKMPAKELYGYVTNQAAQLLRLRRGQGAIVIGAAADLVAVRDSGLSPADTLARLSFRDIELVLLGGRVQLTSSNMLSRLPARLCAGLQPLSIEGIIRWIRAPLDRLFEETSAHLPGAIRLGGKRVRLDTED